MSHHMLWKINGLSGTLVYAIWSLYKRSRASSVCNLNAKLRLFTVGVRLRQDYVLPQLLFVFSLTG